MILDYCEIKESVQDSYDSLHKEFSYSVKDTLYATIGEYDYSDNYKQTDECCIYLNFALLFVENNENIDFMKERLFELINEKYMEMYKAELKDSFSDFLDDIVRLKTIIESM